MRKFKLLALALVIGTASLFAYNVENPIETKKEIRAEMVKMLKSPEFVVEEDINVVLKFTFNSEGEIVVLCPGCKNKDIANYINTYLNQRKFKNPGVENQIYKVPLKIKAI